MPVEVFMPRLTDSMEEGTVVKWLKQVGEEVKKGEPLLEVATDKANMEMESFESGVLDKILVGEGESVPIGTTIAQLRQPGEAAAAPAATPQAPAAPQAPATPAAAPRVEVPQTPPPAAPTPAPEPEEGERLKASPLARRLAEEHGLDLRQIEGTGPGGRITKEDVEDLLARPAAAAPAAPAPAAPVAAPPPAAAPGPAAPLTRMQETIVRRMVESKQTVPHFYVTVEIDMGQASRLRRAANAAAGGGFEVSYNDLVVKAAALTLRKFPLVNASYRDGRIQMNEQINVGVAVALPDGLVVPVIHSADAKSLRQIASEAKEIFERARSGRLQPDDYLGGTFTVSNLGMYDVDEFAAIINPPQSGILAVGAVKPMPVVLDGEIKVAERLRATLSADHRVYYGATAAQFLKELKRLLENPLEMVLECREGDSLSQQGHPKTEGNAVELERQDLLNLYYFMRLSRAIEERIRKLYLQGKIVGGVYCSDGHEAISVGSAYALQKQDISAPLHRDLGAHLVRGLSPRQVFAQYLGRGTGPTRGRDGNVHTGDLSLGTIAMVSMLGTSIPIAAGAALAFKMRGEPRVAMTYIGDGGSNTGDFHEGLNFAAVLGLPVVVIIENNQFAYSTPLSRSVHVPDIASRAQGYGIPGVVVDGNDVLAVYHTAREAVDRARGGGGPTLIEAKTMRVRGHSEHDDAFYVPQGLREEWLKRDPIARFETHLRSQGLMDDSLGSEVSRRIEREIEAGVEFADKSPFPDPEELTDGVFKQAPPAMHVKSTKAAKI